MEQTCAAPQLTHNSSAASVVIYSGRPYNCLCSVAFLCRAGYICVPGKDLIRRGNTDGRGACSHRNGMPTSFLTLVTGGGVSAMLGPPACPAHTNVCQMQTFHKVDDISDINVLTAHATSGSVNAGLANSGSHCPNRVPESSLAVDVSNCQASRTHTF